MRKLALLATVAAVAALAPASQARQNDLLPSAKACTHYKEHVFEICTAYVANSSLGALWWYYKFGHSANPARATAAHNRLASRYYQPALGVIERRTAKWGETEVALPLFEIDSVDSNLSANRAILKTHEKWRVKNKAGRVLYRDDGSRAHWVTMCRTSGLVLHKWVVVKFGRDDNYPCNDLPH